MPTLIPRIIRFRAYRLGTTFSVDATKEEIRQYFAHNGWNLISVYVAPPIGGVFDVTVNANVYSNYSDADCARQIQDIFNGSDYLISGLLVAGNTPPPSTTPNTGGASTYVVQSGDTLSKIANRFQMSLATLLAMNPQITNPNVISVGQIINVKQGGIVPNPSTGGTPTTKPPTGGTPSTNPPPSQKSWFDTFWDKDAKTFTAVGLGAAAVIAIVVITKK